MAFTKREGVTFLICFRKRRVPRRGGGGGGFPQKMWGSDHGGNYATEFLSFSHHHFFLVHCFAFCTDNHEEQLDDSSCILYI